MTPLPSNPYSHCLEKVKLSTNISAEDAQFLKLLFPALVGKFDIILSNLVSNLIHELRSAGLNDSDPANFGWNVDHPNYDLLSRLLRPSDRKSDGGASRPRDEHGRTPELREVLCDSPSLGSNSQGRADLRHSEGEKAEDLSPKRRVPKVSSGLDLLAQLKSEGII